MAKHNKNVKLRRFEHIRFTPRFVSFYSSPENLKIRSLVQRSSERERSISSHGQTVKHFNGSKHSDYFNVSVCVYLSYTHIDRQN